MYPPEPQRTHALLWLVRQAISYAGNYQFWSSHLEKLMNEQKILFHPNPISLLKMQVL